MKGTRKSESLYHESSILSHRALNLMLKQRGQKLEEDGFTSGEFWVKPVEARNPDWQIMREKEHMWKTEVRATSICEISNLFVLSYSDLVLWQIPRLCSI